MVVVFDVQLTNLTSLYLILKKCSAESIILRIGNEALYSVHTPISELVKKSLQAEFLWLTDVSPTPRNCPKTAKVLLSKIIKALLSIYLKLTLYFSATSYINCCGGLKASIVVAEKTNTYKNNLHFKLA